MIQDFQKVFRSIIKSLEVIYVIEGIKPCARILVNEAEESKVKDFLLEKNLNYSVSDFKLLKEGIVSENYSDFSVKAKKDDSRNGSLIFYVSKDEKCNTAKKLEEENNHFELGILLGYPQCCCNFFEENFSDKTTDLTLRSLENSKGNEFSFLNNICARHFDVSLLSHFPCSFECEESMDIAQKNLELVKKHSPEIAKLFESMLKCAVVYTLNEGVFVMRNYEKSGEEIYYSNPICTSKSKLSYLISSGKRIQILSKNRFFVEDELVEGKDKGIMVFA